MLINLSNHPSNDWGREQTNAALYFIHTKDISFPEINPAATEVEIIELAEKYLSKCLNLFKEYNDYNNSITKRDYNHAVHIQGEFTFVYALVNLLKAEGIKCVASTSERKIIKEKDGSKTLIFNFVQFREYI
ncbi:MAG: hypothetical protein JXR68_04745 [Bacteroidales bacterium]|nr:hypothetical protein [Bacteroidales bacterium]